MTNKKSGRPKKEKKFYEKQEFLDLRNEWYEKLKNDDKFNDIEWFPKNSSEPVATFQGKGSFNSITEFQKKYDPYQEEMFLRYRQLSFEYPEDSKEFKILNSFGEGMAKYRIAKHFGWPVSEVEKCLKSHFPKIQNPSVWKDPHIDFMDETTCRPAKRSSR